MSGLYGYLNDHLAGAAAAIRLAERCRVREPQSELGRVLQALLGEIEEDRDVLQQVITALGGSPNPVKRASAVGMERLGSLRMALPVLGPGSGEPGRTSAFSSLNPLATTSGSRRAARLPKARSLPFGADVTRRSGSR